MLFSDKRRHMIQMPALSKDGNRVNMASLVNHLCLEEMKDPRKDLFVLGDHLYVLKNPCPSHHQPLYRP